MLCIKRRIGQRLYLLLPDGSRAFVEILDVDRRDVTLGVDAPEDVKLLREELLPEKQRGQNP